ncbi:hypothetical protein BC830DRAFT_631912 [Chytriomyces sp. MP71]|nr:hypothetical protein BC830DRAFT_631912 [Chytriomyces sp. MP71]
MLISRFGSANVDAAVCKNAILGATLVISAVPEMCLIENVQERVCVTLFALITSRNDQLARVALQCTRSFMTLGLKGGSSESAQITGAAFIRILLPALLCFITSELETLSCNGLLDEVVKVMLVPCFVSSVATMSLIVSVLVRVSSTPAGAQAHATVLSNLLQLASQHQIKFREMMAYLSPDVRAALEAGFKTVLLSSQLQAQPDGATNALASTPGAVLEESLAPKIQLKSFGSF